MPLFNDFPDQNAERAEVIYSHHDDEITLRNGSSYAFLSFENAYGKTQSGDEWSLVNGAITVKSRSPQFIESVRQWAAAHRVRIHVIGVL